MKAIETNPVNNIVIPTPLNSDGTFEYLILCLIAAIDAIAIKNPIPEPNPYTVDSKNVYSLSTRNIEPPKIAQFTAMSGKNIPRLIVKNFQRYFLKIYIKSAIDISILEERAKTTIMLLKRFKGGFYPTI